MKVNTIYINNINSNTIINGHNQSPNLYIKNTISNKINNSYHYRFKRINNSSGISPNTKLNQLSNSLHSRKIPKENKDNHKIISIPSYLEKNNSQTTSQNIKYNFIILHLLFCIIF